MKSYHLDALNHDRGPSQHRFLLVVLINCLELIKSCCFAIFVWLFQQSQHYNAVKCFRFKKELFLDEVKFYFASYEKRNIPNKGQYWCFHFEHCTFTRDINL